MRGILASWQAWAILSATFAALTAIFAKVGVENVNSDFATLIRTVVVLFAAAFRICFRYVAISNDSVRPQLDLPHTVRPRDRRFVAVLFPRAEDRRRRARGADRQA